MKNTELYEMGELMDLDRGFISTSVLLVVCVVAAGAAL